MAGHIRPVLGQTVLITGAARGIGAEAARALAAAGANVALVGLEPERLAEVAASCGTKAAWFEADVTDWAALEAAVAGAVERFGGIDVVVANAGIGAGGMVRSVDPAAFERTIEVNLLGVWRTVRTCLPHVIERRGYVLVVASLAAVVHGAGMASYTASKAGVEAFSNSLRGEVRHLGVDVGVVYPTWIGTDLVAGADAHPAMGFARKKLPGIFGKTYPLSVVGPAFVRAVERRQRRLPLPGWVASLIFLRGWLSVFSDRFASDTAAEMDARFLEDVERRGVEEASAPVSVRT